MRIKWSDIANSDYEVSSNGQIRNKKTKLILKQQVNHKGYLVVSIKIKNRKKTVFVHRLVANAFIPNPSNYPQVNHKDENKCNNLANNLEWCSAKYNSNYGTRNYRRVKHTDFKKRNKTYGYQHRLDNVDMVAATKSLYHSVEMIDMHSHKIVKRFDSIRQAARQLHGESSHISEAVNGKRRSACGYLWRRC